MAYEGYACYGGVELINNARTAAYSRAAGLSVRCDGDPWLRDSLGDDPYVSTAEDPAPWYDRFVPDSKGFLGILGLDVQGTGGTSKSGWTDLLGDGARPGPLRRGAREIGFTALAIATDGGALSYGLGWLGSALRGELCDRSCDGDQLQMYAALPEPPRETTSCGDPLPPPGPGHLAALDAAHDAWVRGTQLLRTLYHCRLLEGPTITATRPITGGVLAEITFTIKAGVPYWYHEPSVVWKMSETRPEDFFTEVVTNWTSGYLYTECEQTRADANCLRPPPDPNYNCPVVVPPVIAAPPKDPCYKGDFYPNGWRSLYRVPAGLAAEWLEKAPVIELTNGNRQIRSMLLRWHANPVNRPPRPENLDPCGVCAELWIAYLPAYAKIVIDGRRQRAHVECVGNKTAEPVLYGAGGGVYTWPVLECSTAMFLELAVDGRYGESTGVDATISLAARQDAC